MKNRTKGIVLALTSAFAFGLSPIFTTITLNEGSNGIMTMFLRNLISIPLLLAFILYFGISLKLSKKQFFQLTILNIIGASTTGCLLFSSYKYTGISLATCLHFVYPVLIMIACLYIFKEKPTIAKIAALILSLLGIFLSLDIQTFNLIGFSMALISGVTYAFYVIYLDKTGLKLHNVAVITLYSCIINSICIFIFSLFTETFTLDISIKGWGSAVMVAILSTIIGVAFLQAALQYIDSPTAAIMCTMEPVTSVILAIIILNESVGVMKLISCVLIISAVFVIALDNKRGYAGGVDE